MMTRQLRPRQVKASLDREWKARKSVQEPASAFHQGQRLKPQLKSGSMAAIFTCLPSSIEGLAKRWRPSMSKLSFSGGDYEFASHRLFQLLHPIN